MRISILVALVTLSGCSAFQVPYTISKIVIDGDERLCTITVQFPEDYSGAERGTTQSYTVPPLYKPVANERTWGVGTDLRRYCGGFFIGAVTGTETSWDGLPLAVGS